MTGAERAVGRLLLTGLLLLLACRNNIDVPEPYYQADFEEVCDGLPCSWDQIRGEPGQARYVETFHPGEHGIALRGDGVTVRGPGRSPMSISLLVSSLSARVLARCDAGNSLTIRLAAIDENTGAADTLSGSVSPGDGWAGASRVSLSASTALMDGGPGGLGSTPFLQIVSVTISKSGPGVCEVAELTVDTFASTEPDPPEGC